MLNKKYCASLAYVLMAICVLIVPAMTVYVLVVSHWHGPFRDMWEIYPFLKKIIDHSWTLADLWESYGYSHRLLIPRLFFILDYQFSDASNHLLIAVSILCQVLICGIFAGRILTSACLSLLQKYALISVVVCLQFSGTLLFNFMHTFDVQWFLCCLLVTAAFYVLSIPSEKSDLILLVSGLLIILASLNNFSGLAAWPIWMTFALKKNNHNWKKFIWMFLSCLCIPIFVYGVKTTGIDHHGFNKVISYCIYVVFVFPFIYLSNPISNDDYAVFAYFGIIAVLPTFFILTRFWYRYLFNLPNKNTEAISLFVASTALFSYGVAIMTALGRGYDPTNMHAMRYQNIVMLFWSGAFLLMFSESQDFLNKAKHLFQLLVVIIFIGFLACQPKSWQQNLRLGSQVNRAHLALMMGFSRNVPVIAPTVSRPMIYVPDYNLEKERLLHELSRKGIYHGALADHWLVGIDTKSIARSCSNLVWRVLPSDINYSHYIGFNVSGETSGFSAAALVATDGKIVALAIPDSRNDLSSSIAYSLNIHKPMFRGFALRGTAEPYTLVMFDMAGKEDCKLDPGLN